MSPEETELPPFPTDDAALIAVEHALAGAYELDEQGDHRLVGADYSLAQLLDFMAGVARGPEADAIHVQLLDGSGVPIYLDERPHYTERSIILALIREIRRLRGEGGST